jgi:predicted RNase H-like HicB family nuclease
MIFFCEECRKEITSVNVAPETETIRVKDEIDITTRSSMITCPRCGKDVWDNVLSDMDLIRAYREYERITGKKLRPESTQGEVLDFKYPFVLQFEDFDGHKVWVCESKSLKGCVSQGDTKSDALREFAENEDSWIEGAKECGIPIPEGA